MGIKLWLYRKLVNLLIFFDMCKAARTIQHLYMRKMRGMINFKFKNLELELYPDQNLSEGEFLFYPELFNYKELKFLKSNLKGGDVFIDVGANVGLYSLLLSDVIANGKIISIEAYPVHAKRFKRNIELSGLNNIEVIENAVWNEKCQKTFKINNTDTGSNKLVEDTIEESITVSCDTLYNIIKGYNLEKINGMKIDIEGAEYDVMKKFFEEAPENLFPEYVVLERFGDREKGNKNNVELFKEHGYEVVKKLYMNTLFKRK